MTPRFLALVLVIVAVGLNLMSAVVLKEAADIRQAPMIAIGVLILIVIFLNFLRVLLWSAIHKRFRLSDVYPLTSLFFPMILMLSALYGEEIGLAKLVGTAFITLGVLVLIRSKPAEILTDESPGDTP